MEYAVGIFAVVGVLAWRFRRWAKVEKLPWEDTRERLQKIDKDWKC